MRIEDRKIGPWYGNGETGTCSCGAPATCEHIVSGKLACDACVYGEALTEHYVEHRRDGNQVVALVPYTDASGKLGVEETTITSPQQLMQVLGY